VKPSKNINENVNLIMQESFLKTHALKDDLQLISINNLSLKLSSLSKS
jgi:hypothetical protein